MKCLSTRAFVVLLGSLLVLGCLGCLGCSSKDSGFVASGSEGNTPDAHPTNGEPLGDACSIEFVSANPSTIALKGTGGPARSEISVLVFKVFDMYGHPIPKEAVEFKLSTEIGGLSISASRAFSDSDGLVQVAVKAGTMPTHIRVQATLASDSSIAIVSDELAVSTGLPDKNSTSISAKTYNPEAWNYNNETVCIMFNVADHFNNFVPDGTMVYFTTEGGSIGSSYIVKDGVCEATWQSSDPRPKDGRVTILAFCIGEESFIDLNTNGFFDQGDQFDPENDDLAEPFRDDNENGIRDTGEEYWDYNNNRQFDGKDGDYDGKGIYNGTLCSDEAEALGLCTTELVYNQASLVLIMSGSVARITFSPDSPKSLVDLRGKASETVTISIEDFNKNPMPADTKVSVKTTNGKIVGNDSFTVPNTNLSVPLQFSVVIEPTPDDGQSSGMLTVEVTTPKGNKSTAAISIVDDDGSTSGGGPLGDACYIEFISVTPKTIALKGTGGPSRSEVSVLVFKVVDEYRNPIPDQIVEFKLSTEIGGLSLTNSSGASNSNGLVQVTVKAGTMPTHIRVQATLASDPLINIVSDELAITTGLPDQDSISLSAETLNPEAWIYNNEVVNITFLAADHFNNFVPDGTVVYFTTGGGSIRGSDVVKDGICTVPWRSGNPRPDNGRFSILAVCIGEESFTNNNASGLFDKEDWFTGPDLAEPFRDDNENGTRDTGEEYWDYNNNGKFDGKDGDYDGKGIYNGTLCSDEAEALGLCTTELVYNQASIILVMSGSFADITFSPGSVDLRGKSYQTVQISIADVNNNPMPADTTVLVSATNGKIIGNNSFKVPNTNRHGPSKFSVTLEPSTNDRTFGTLTVEVTTPHQNQSSASISVDDDN